MADLPPMETPVMLTMANGDQFLARRIIVEDGEQSCWAWATEDEHEPNCPPCWTDGVCWGNNDDNKPSERPIEWRYRK